MPTTPASLAVRRCLRGKSALAACSQRQSIQLQRLVSGAFGGCVAGASCPARAASSTSSSLPSTTSLRSTESTRAPLRALRQAKVARCLGAESTRRYSSSIRGTVGAGEKGTGGEEAARPTDALEAPEHLNEKEREIWGMLQRELEPTKLEVQDISGGCGSMYGIEVVSERFRGLNMLKQQRLVNQVLGEEIKGWHGVQLRTGVP